MGPSNRSVVNFDRITVKAALPDATLRRKRREFIYFQRRESLSCVRSFSVLRKIRRTILESAELLFFITENFLIFHLI